MVQKKPNTPRGTIGMILEIPQKIKEFSKIFFGELGNSKPKLLALYIAGFLLSVEKRTFKGLGDTIYFERRYKTSVGKFFRRKTFYSHKIYKKLLKRLIGTNN